MKNLGKKAIDRLFAVLTERYGQEFIDRFEAHGEDAAKASWAAGLGRYDEQRHVIGEAIKQLGSTCPTLSMFYDLCERIELGESAPHEKPAPARPAEQSIAAPAPPRPPIARPAPTVDHKAWAKRLVARHCAGERLNKVQIEFARQALKLPADGSRDQEYAA